MEVVAGVDAALGVASAALSVINNVVTLYNDIRDVHESLKDSGDRLERSRLVLLTIQEGLQNGRALARSLEHWFNWPIFKTILDGFQTAVTRLGKIFAHIKNHRSNIGAYLQRRHYVEEMKSLWLTIDTTTNSLHVVITIKNSDLVVWTHERQSATHNLLLEELSRLSSLITSTQNSLNQRASQRQQSFLLCEPSQGATAMLPELDQEDEEDSRRVNQQTKNAVNSARLLLGSAQSVAGDLGTVKRAKKARIMAPGQTRGAAGRRVYSDPALVPNPSNPAVRLSTPNPDGTKSSSPTSFRFSGGNVLVNGTDILFQPLLERIVELLGQDGDHFDEIREHLASELLNNHRPPDDAIAWADQAPKLAMAVFDAGSAVPRDIKVKCLELPLVYDEIVRLLKIEEAGTLYCQKDWGRATDVLKPYSHLLDKWEAERNYAQSPRMMIPLAAVAWQNSLLGRTDTISILEASFEFDVSLPPTVVWMGYDSLASACQSASRWNDAKNYARQACNAAWNAFGRDHDLVHEGVSRMVRAFFRSEDRVEREMFLSLLPEEKRFKALVNTSLKSYCEGMVQKNTRKSVLLGYQYFRENSEWVTCPIPWQDTQPPILGRPWYSACERCTDKHIAKCLDRGLAAFAEETVCGHHKEAGLTTGMAPIHRMAMSRCKRPGDKQELEAFMKEELDSLLAFGSPTSEETRRLINAEMSMHVRQTTEGGAVDLQLKVTPLWIAVLAENHSVLDYLLSPNLRGILDAAKGALVLSLLPLVYPARYRFRNRRSSSTSPQQTLEDRCMRCIERFPDKDLLEIFSLPIIVGQHSWVFTSARFLDQLLAVCKKRGMDLCSIRVPVASAPPINIVGASSQQGEKVNPVKGHTTSLLGAAVRVFDCSSYSMTLNLAAAINLLVRHEFDAHFDAATTDGVHLGQDDTRVVVSLMSVAMWAMGKMVMFTPSNDPDGEALSVMVRNVHKLMVRGASTWQFIGAMGMIQKKANESISIPDTVKVDIADLELKLREAGEKEMGCVNM